MATVISCGGFTLPVLLIALGMSAAMSRPPRRPAAPVALPAGGSGAFVETASGAQVADTGPGI